MCVVYYDSPEERCSIQMQGGIGEGKGQGKFSRRDAGNEYSEAKGIWQERGKIK